MIPWIPPGAPSDLYPPPEQALRDPNGLLCAGGDLSPARLVEAYRRGIFPWYSEGEPILWWSPDPRMVFLDAEIHVSRRMRRTLRSWNATIHFDQHFAEIVRACQAPRSTQSGTWITDAMFQAYCDLHAKGFAHCAVARSRDELLGGIYGIALGRVFFGESMFSATTDGSKAVLIGLGAKLREAGFVLIDGQVESAHLARMGARTMPRSRFCELLRRHANPGVDLWSTLKDGPIGA